MANAVLVIYFWIVGSSSITAAAPDRFGPEDNR
jgi:hypothetical protein